MDFKDYYTTLGVAPDASADLIKRAYRKLARKYHPDVSKEPNAENRFKEVAEAHEALIDPERRAAYDDLARRHARGEAFEPPAGWGQGDASSGGQRRAAPGARGADDFSDFFESLFGQASSNGGAGRGRRGAHFADGQPGHGQAAQGEDQHARIEINLLDAYLGARHTFSLRRSVSGANGHTHGQSDGQASGQHRQVEVNIPKGVRPGQHLRLAGMGNPGHGGAPAGDLYLEIALRADARFRVDGADVWVDLPVAPWEAALGASVTVTTPDGAVQLAVPAGSGAGRKLRLKGKGLPGKTAGDLYAVLQISLPAADSDSARAAYAALASAFAGFDARQSVTNATHPATNPATNPATSPPPHQA